MISYIKNITHFLMRKYDKKSQNYNHKQNEHKCHKNSENLSI